MKIIRLFLTSLVLSSYLVIEAQAQADKFYIEAADAEVKVKTNKSVNWINPGIASSFNGEDSLHVIKGKVWLKKNGTKKTDPICASPAMSVINAWNLAPKNNTLNRTSPLGILKGNEPKDSLEIQFGFINHLGDSTIAVNKSDTLEAMVISHTSADTLYAYVYWELTEKDIVPMNDYIENPTCIVVPGYNSVFPFNQVMPITWPYDSKIIIIYSKEKDKAIPEKKWDKNMLFYQEMSDIGFKVNHLIINYVNE